MDYWNCVLFISIIIIVGLSIIILLVGCKIWKNLIVTLLISTSIGFFSIYTTHLIFADSFHLLCNPATHWYRINLEIALMSLLIGGVSTFIIMLGTLIAKNNR